MYVRIPLPSSMLLSNLIGLAGLVAVVVAVGLLAGFAWALLCAGVMAVAMCALAQNAVAKPQTKAAAAAAPLKAVPAKAV